MHIKSTLVYLGVSVLSFQSLLADVDAMHRTNGISSIDFDAISGVGSTMEIRGGQQIETWSVGTSGDIAPPSMPIIDTKAENLNIGPPGKFFTKNGAPIDPCDIVNGRIKPGTEIMVLSEQGIRTNGTVASRNDTQQIISKSKNHKHRDVSGAKQWGYGGTENFFGFKPDKDAQDRFTSLKTLGDVNPDTSWYIGTDEMNRAIDQGGLGAAAETYLYDAHCESTSDTRMIASLVGGGGAGGGGGAPGGGGGGARGGGNR